MHNTPLKLRTAISPDHVVEPADILDTKKALMTLGYYEPLDGAEPGAWVDSDLFTGIKRFQRDNGLKVDALVRPGGRRRKRSMRRSKMCNRHRQTTMSRLQMRIPPASLCLIVTVCFAATQAYATGCVLHNCRRFAKALR